MALPVNLEDLINHRRVESARIEYKAGWNPERVLHTLCAFANDVDNWGGGYIILGVDEKDGQPVFPVKGLATESIDGLQKELLNVCHLLEPLYIPVVEPCTYEGKTLLVLWAPGGCERPYKCPERIVKEGRSSKAYYIRKLASTIKATPADEERLFEQSVKIPFDDRVNVRADIAELKINLMSDYLHSVGSALYPESENMSVSSLAPIFSTPVTRAWFSVVLPVNESFCVSNDENSAFVTSDKIAPIIAPIIAPKVAPITSSNRVTVMTSEEELQEIILKIRQVLARKKLRKSLGVVQRLAHIVQEMNRNDRVLLSDVANQIGMSPRTIDLDISLLKKLKIIAAKGATRNAQWRVLV